MTARKVRPIEKICTECCSTFVRAEESDKQWDVVGRCPACAVERLKQRIRDGSPVDANGCWIWKGSTKNGYGQITVNDENRYTHHLAYELFIGPIPEGLQVLHKCDVKRCNNPEHFFPGTQLENIQDMRDKGRGAKPPVHRGLVNSNATLTDEQVAEIRHLRSISVPQREVARRFGCSQSTVWRLAHEITRAAR